MKMKTPKHLVLKSHVVQSSSHIHQGRQIPTQSQLLQPQCPRGELQSLSSVSKYSFSAEPVNETLCQPYRVKQSKEQATAQEAWCTASERKAHSVCL